MTDAVERLPACSSDDRGQTRGDARRFFELRRSLQSSNLDCRRRMIVEQIADAGEECFVENAVLAARCGMSVRTLQRHLAALEAAGWIEVTFDGRRQRRRVSRHRLAASTDDTATSKWRGRDDSLTRLPRHNGVSATSKWRGALDSRTPSNNSFDHPPHLDERPVTSDLPTVAETVESLAESMVQHWYAQTGRPRPPGRVDVERLADVLRRSSKSSTQKAIQRSIAFVKETGPRGFKSCRTMAGVITRIDEWSQQGHRAEQQDAAERQRRLQAALAAESAERRRMEVESARRAWWDGLTAADRQQTIHRIRNRGGFYEMVSDEQIAAVAMVEAVPMQGELH